MTETLLADLELIRDAAVAAGEKAVVMRAAGLERYQKSDGSPVTNADLAVDALLRATLTEARPAYGWLSEETVDDPARLSCERVFIVDPIDGTRAYIRDRPWWGVSIAVVENGRPIAGVVAAPDRREVFEATLGGGARMNGKPIAASQTQDLEGAALLADAQMMKHPAWPTPWPEMRMESRNAIAYRLCSVACGEFDAMLALSPKNEWDMAAGDLIATESGCLVTDHRGRTLAYNRAKPVSPSLVCAGPALHRLILSRLEPIDLPG
jgi:myo-inositol-1(or 4)-monophosphatase